MSELVPDPLSLALESMKRARPPLRILKGSRRVCPSPVERLLDSTYVLPSFGIEEKGLSARWA